MRSGNRSLCKSYACASKAGGWSAPTFKCQPCGNFVINVHLKGHEKEIKGLKIIIRRLWELSL